MSLINYNNLRAIKLGAVYPDLTEKLSKISQHGAFHGRGAWLAGPSPWWSASPGRREPDQEVPGAHRSPS